ncbi:hypothetical protein [Nonomuraea roseola]|uniref:hypothetical protein n=1 Tax=Nonomuraea roseola TaxID=46179 RepID=UPI0031F90645
MHRLLGMAVLKIDTGASGGGEQEGESTGVSVAEAERLKDVLLRSVRAARPPEPPPASTAAPRGTGASQRPHSPRARPCTGQGEPPLTPRSSGPSRSRRST